MRFIATADTDIGISKKTNQDSVLVKHATVDGEEVLMAIVCDGMGGLEKGELASATVIRAFAQWFEEELPYELENPDIVIMAAKWSLLLKELNVRIHEYSTTNKIDGMGTTFSGILFVGKEFLVVHVGDSRIYRINEELIQMTEDHTFVAREVRRGNMTEEQALTSKSRNLLLQCVGASKTVEPQVIIGTIERGMYMLCSDGFRHEITPEEMYASLNIESSVDKRTMHSNVTYLMEQVKTRGEKDNISCVLIKVE